MTKDVSSFGTDSLAKPIAVAKSSGSALSNPGASSSNSSLQSDEFASPEADLADLEWRTPAILIAPTKMHLWPEEPKLDAYGGVTYGATLELGTTIRKQLWYNIPSARADFVTESCDPYVLGSIFIAAVNSAELIVHGQASPSLLRNLIDFQNAWKTWWPHRFSVMGISADKEIEDEISGDKTKAICAYSGGVDSNFTIYRHKLIDIGRQQRNIEAALLIQGLDMPLKQAERFQKITSKSKSLLESIGVDLITLKTNFREINPDWNNTHGAALASSLMLFKKHFNEGIIASTYSYHQLLLPWGSNPISDPLMSSNSFQVVHDAPHWSRFSKITALKAWPEAYDNLRVCFELDAEERNCGKCFKCICTWFAARISKIEPPLSLPAPTPEVIHSLRNVPESEMFAMDDCVQLLKATDVPKSIIRAFESCINYNRRRLLIERRGNPGMIYRAASAAHACLSRYLT